MASANTSSFHRWNKLSIELVLKIVEASIDSTGPKSITGLLTADKHAHSTIKNYERSIVKAVAARDQQKALTDFPGIAPDVSGFTLKWLNTITARYQVAERLTEVLMKGSWDADSVSPAFLPNIRKFLECGFLLLYRLHDLVKSDGDKCTFIDQLPSSSLAPIIIVLFEARWARDAITPAFDKMPDVLVDVVDDRATQCQLHGAFALKHGCRWDQVLWIIMKTVDTGLWKMKPCDFDRLIAGTPVELFKSS